MPPTGSRKGKSPYKGFSTPIKTYEVNRSAVTTGWCMAGGFAVMAPLILVCGFVAAENSPKNKWLMPALGGVFALLFLFAALQMVRRLIPGAKQKAVLYPEGVVVWRDGEPVPYRWDEIRWVETKGTPLHRGTPNRGLQRVGMVGKEFEATILLEDGDAVTLNALIPDVADLADRVKAMKVDAADPAPADDAASPFGGMF